MATKVHSTSLHEIRIQRPDSEIGLYDNPTFMQLNADKKLKLEHDNKYRNFILNLNVLIICRSLKGESVSIEAAIKRLEFTFGRDLSNKFDDLYLFLTMYSKNLQAVITAAPFPKSKSLSGTNYADRFEALNKIKSEGIKDLKNILEGEN